MGAIKRLTRPRFLFVYPLAVLAFLTAHTTETAWWIAIGLLALGEGVRFWANGYVGHRKVNWTQRWRHDPKIGALITAGPYAYVRHPLYFGSLLIALGVYGLVGRWWLGAAGLLALFVTYRRKIAQEERVLAHEAGETFTRYQAAVPAIFPFRRRYDRRNGSWSWQGIVASREWKTLIWSAAIWMLFYLREEVIQEREHFFGQRPVFRAVLAGIVLTAIAVDAIVELRRQRAKRRPAAA